MYVGDLFKQKIITKVAVKALQQMVLNNEEGPVGFILLV